MICSHCKIDTPESMMLKNGWCKKCSYESVKRFRGTLRCKAYTVYSGMINRCYNETSKRYNKYGAIGVKVNDIWLGEDGFNNFFAWYTLNAVHGYQLDKDILCNEKHIEPHEYGPDTCKFVHRTENQRNYNTLLSNNTSGYTGVCYEKSNNTWNFRLTFTNGKNFNRSGFLTALEAAKSREAIILAFNLNFKIEHVGSSMLITEKPSNINSKSSIYNAIYRQNNKFTGVVKMTNGKRLSIGQHNTEHQAAQARNAMIEATATSNINIKSSMFGHSYAHVIAQCGAV